MGGRHERAAMGLVALGLTALAACGSDPDGAPIREEACDELARASCEWRIECGRPGSSLEPCIQETSAECCAGRDCTQPANGSRDELRACRDAVEALPASSCEGDDNPFDEAPADELCEGLIGEGDGGDAGAPDAGSVADPEMFCQDRRFWVCRRDNTAGRIDDAEYEACLAPIEDECAGAAWPAGCAPTPAEAEACLALLRDPDRLAVDSDEVLAMPACQLCP